ncbi:hypothetical protein ACKKBF_B39330 [Auxenochlorella protothecoides x Auxenochlorella symbiontica]|uniref:Sodium/hydrogen exchanger n=5 Tax=Auxenochlorella protothecoides TaxID=3075 RepID=A0A1D2AA97_AUXPR
MGLVGKGYSGEAVSSEEITLLWALLIVVIVVTYLIQRHKLNWIPPASCAMVIGIFAGILSKVIGLAKPLRFSPEVFFYALLPPIVFAAGFTLKKKQFFHNLGPILMFAVVGTFISALVFGFATYLLVLLKVVNITSMAGAPLVECLMYGSAISSIDPVATLAVLTDTDVPPMLYNLVFGESVLNDAVAIVLFRSLAKFYDTPMGLSSLLGVLVSFVALALGSLAIGVAVALAAAFLLKRLERPAAGRSHVDGTLYEIAIVVMGSYLAYLLAELAGMSGIVALFFSGVCHAHYSYYNIGQDAQITLRKLSEFLAFACEMFVMAYLGLQVATMHHKFDLGLFVTGVPLAVFSRAANVFPCSFILNQGLQHRMPRNLQLMLWAVGLRGAVAYGLVVNLPRSDAPGETGVPAIETATLFIVVVSTLVMGSATGPLLTALDLVNKDDAQLHQMSLAEDGLASPMHGGPELGRFEVTIRSWTHEKFKELDELILKPLFGGNSNRTEDWVQDATIRSSGLSWDGGDDSRRPSLDSLHRLPHPFQTPVATEMGSGALTPPQRVTSPEHVRGGNDGTEAAEAEEHGGLVAVAAALAPPHDSQKAPSTPNGHT